MPLREYVCPDCGKFEVLELSINKIKKIIKCEKCGKESNLILSTCNSQFVGGGFYCTDYKNSKDKPKKKSENGIIKEDKKTGE
jgi:putative FmdB family regulatory protein